MHHRLQPPLVAGALVAVSLILAVPAAAGSSPVDPATEPAAASTERVSVTSREKQFDTYHDRPAVSDSGRYVAFDQGISSVYVRDRTRGRTELIADEYASDPDISGDGNLVAMVQLTAPPAAYGYNIYLFNRSTHTSTLVSLRSAGNASANCRCYNPSMSANGDAVAFEGDAADLVPGDTNEVRDVFVRDGSAGTTERVSVSSSEVAGNAASSNPAVSANGRFVAFTSSATNLVLSDTNGKADVFLRDRQAGTTERVSVSSSEAQGNDFSQAPDVSETGRYVAFDSKAGNWPGATGAVLTYVRDRTAGTTERVSVSSSEQVADNVFGHGDPAISDDGKFVTFSSAADNLVGSDTNNQPDIFLRDLATGTTTRLSVSSSGAQANNSSRTPAIAGGAQGAVVAFVSEATNLVRRDTNAWRDIFVRTT